MFFWLVVYLPLWKIWVRQWEKKISHILIYILWKIKNVWNHQPVNISLTIINHYYPIRFADGDFDSKFTAQASENSSPSSSESNQTPIPAVADSLRRRPRTATATTRPKSAEFRQLSMAFWSNLPERLKTQNLHQFTTVSIGFHGYWFKNFLGLN